MKRLIEMLFSIAKLLCAVSLILMFAAFIWAMIRATIEIVKEDYESKRISSASKKDDI